MTDTSVETWDLTYRAQRASLVSEVTLRLREGELTAVIGPNGAGKSTLIRLLGGMLRPSAGGVMVAGVDLARSSLADLARVRSILGERTTPRLSYTVAQIVDMGRYPHRNDPSNTPAGDRATVTEAMRMTGISSLASRLFTTLSQGEQTLVSMARVVAQDTPIFLLDEPTTGLDIAHQERAMTLLRTLCRQGRSVVAVLHDLNLAATYADRMILMSHGKVIATGPPKDVLRADLLSEVYGHPVVVVDHPFRDASLVLTADLPFDR
jgi:iron complex transport system ATP-binding protein